MVLGHFGNIYDVINTCIHSLRSKMERGEEKMYRLQKINILQACIFILIVSTLTIGSIFIVPVAFIIYTQRFVCKTLQMLL